MTARRPRNEVLLFLVLSMSTGYALDDRYRKRENVPGTYTFSEINPKSNNQGNVRRPTAYEIHQENMKPHYEKIAQMRESMLPTRQHNNGENRDKAEEELPTHIYDNNHYGLSTGDSHNSATSGNGNDFTKLGNDNSRYAPNVEKNYHSDTDDSHRNKNNEYAPPRGGLSNPNKGIDRTSDPNQFDGFDGPFQPNPRIPSSTHFGNGPRNQQQNHHHHDFDTRAHPHRIRVPHHHHHHHLKFSRSIPNIQNSKYIPSDSTLYDDSSSFVNPSVSESLLPVAQSVENIGEVFASLNSNDDYEKNENLNAVFSQESYPGNQNDVSPYDTKSVDENVPNFVISENFYPHTAGFNSDSDNYSKQFDASGVKNRKMHKTAFMPQKPLSNRFIHNTAAKNTPMSSSMNNNEYFRHQKNEFSNRHKNIALQNRIRSQILRDKIEKQRNMIEESFLSNPNTVNSDSQSQTSYTFSVRFPGNEQTFDLLFPEYVYAQTQQSDQFDAEIPDIHEYHEGSELPISQKQMHDVQMNIQPQKINFFDNQHRSTKSDFTRPAYEYNEPTNSYFPMPEPVSPKTVSTIYASLQLPENSQSDTYSKAYDANNRFSNGDKLKNFQKNNFIKLRRPRHHFVHSNTESIFPDELNDNVFSEQNKDNKGKITFKLDASNFQTEDGRNPPTVWQYSYNTEESISSPDDSKSKHSKHSVSHTRVVNGKNVDNGHPHKSFYVQTGVLTPETEKDQRTNSFPQDSTDSSTNNSPNRTIFSYLILSHYPLSFRSKAHSNKETNDTSRHAPKSRRNRPPSNKSDDRSPLLETLVSPSVTSLTLPKTSSNTPPESNLPSKSIPKSNPSTIDNLESPNISATSNLDISSPNTQIERPRVRKQKNKKRPSLKLSAKLFASDPLSSSTINGDYSPDIGREISETSHISTTGDSSDLKNESSSAKSKENQQVPPSEDSLLIITTPLENSEPTKSDIKSSLEDSEPEKPEIEDSLESLPTTSDATPDPSNAMQMNSPEKPDQKSSLPPSEAMKFSSESETGTQTSNERSMPVTSSSILYEWLLKKFFFPISSITQSLR